MNAQKKILNNSVIPGQTMLTENQLKFVLSKNNKLSAAMDIHNKTKREDVQEESTTTLNESMFPVNELGKMLLSNAKEGNYVKVLKLIQEGAPFISDWLGMSALHFAALYNHVDVLDILIKSGLNKDTRTKVDRTSLHLAAYEGHYEIVEILLKAGCAVNSRDMLRMTPLHWSVERGHHQVSRLLLKYGADVDAVSKFNKTPISIAIETGETELLEELQNARNNLVVTNRPEAPIVDQNQNETTAAVNSIMLNDKLESDVYDETDEYTENIATGNLKTEPHSEPEPDPDQNDEMELPESELNNDPRLEMLKTLKSMMPTDDRENHLLESALQNGRQLILSEGGKLALKQAKNLHTYENQMQNKVIDDEERNRKTALALKNKITQFKTSGKNVKIFSVDSFKKVYGQNAFNNLNVVNSSNSLKPPTPLSKITRVTNLNEINAKKTIFKSVPNNSNLPLVVPANNLSVVTPTRPVSKPEERDDDLSSMIELCTENDSDQDMDETSDEKFNKTRSISISSTGSFRNKLSVTPNRIKNNVVRLLDIPEICRQLKEQKTEIEYLKKELELSRIQSEEYKMRLERLECKVDEQELRMS